MKKGFHERVHDVIEQSDVILEILDARFPEETRSLSLEERIKAGGKKLVLVMNKSDLISLSKAEEFREKAGERVVFLQAKNRKGVRRLRLILKSLARGAEIKVGIIGFPNTGKSSVINALRGKRVAETSKQAGFTKGERLVRFGNLMLIDTPGVIPFEERDEFKLMLLNARSVNQLKDVEAMGEELAEYLLKNFKEALERRYEIKVGEGFDGERILEEIALKRKRLLKGGVPDILTAAKILINDWQDGDIR